MTLGTGIYRASRGRYITPLPVERSLFRCTGCPMLVLDPMNRGCVVLAEAFSKSRCFLAATSCWFSLRLLFLRVCVQSWFPFFFAGTSGTAFLELRIADGDVAMSSARRL